MRFGLRRRLVNLGQKGENERLPAPTIKRLRGRNFKGAEFLSGSKLTSLKAAPVKWTLAKRGPFFAFRTPVPPILFYFILPVRRPLRFKWPANGFLPFDSFPFTSRIKWLRVAGKGFLCVPRFLKNRKSICKWLLVSFSTRTPDFGFFFHLRPTNRSLPGYPERLNAFLFIIWKTLYGFQLLIDVFWPSISVVYTNCPVVHFLFPWQMCSRRNFSHRENLLSRLRNF